MNSLGIHGSLRTAIPLLGLALIFAPCPQTVAYQEIAASSRLYFEGDRTIYAWPSANNARTVQREAEDAVVDSISRDQLRAFHTMLSSEPHRAGTPGDARACDLMASQFEQMGLLVERQPMWVYLSEPVSASLSIVSPNMMPLSIQEDAVEGDPYSGADGLSFGFNGYAATGDVVGEIVYANNGRKQDFERLAELGIDCTGKIVLARYGGNYRGYKARFAEDAGAVGLIIFTDPKDSGHLRGEVYPEGGYANASYIQRGSILTLPYPGDPLTPFVAATEHADRLDPQDVALPNIPVQPIGYGAAEQIISRMAGEEVPDESWKGGLPHTYRLTGGADLTVRIQIEQTRSLTYTENIIATLPGSTYPDQTIIVGAHHDGWEYGATDPNSGTIVVMELARVFSDLAKRGTPPARSIAFACWGAEEQGIIGSTEYVEANVETLSRGAVAYFNLDMASTGLNIGSSAAPLLKDVILDAARYVPQPIVDEKGVVQPSVESAFDAWLQRANGKDGTRTEPTLGNLGGGSDHVGFYCHLGIPSAGISAGGSAGTSYHSNYDNLAWYRKVVGNDYESAALVAGVSGVTISRLANAPILPLSPRRYAVDLRRHLEALKQKAIDTGLVRDGVLPREWGHFENAIEEFADVAHDFEQELHQTMESRTLSAEQRSRIDHILLQLERRWIITGGIPDRPWFQSFYAATDEDSGYASWMLPAIRYAIEHQDGMQLESALRDCQSIVEKIQVDLEAAQGILQHP